MARLLATKNRSMDPTHLDRRGAAARTAPALAFLMGNITNPGATDPANLYHRGVAPTQVQLPQPVILGRYHLRNDLAAPAP